MKRIIAAWLCAAALTAAVLAGCGNAQQSSAQPTEAATTAQAATEAQTQSGDDPVIVKATGDSDTVVGGWTINAVADSLLTEEQAAIFEDSINNFDQLKMNPIAVIGQQVVAGTNYAFLCSDSTTSEFPTFSWDIAVVYQDLYGKCKLTSIIEINPSNVNTVKTEGEEMVGAWETTAVAKEAKLDDAVKAALDSVMTKEYVPVALLATQVVSGTNYCIMVQEKDGDKTVNYIVKLYVDLQGNAELTSEEIFNLNYYLSVNN